MIPVSCARENDCFRACVASMLELPIEAVPHFIEQPSWPHCVNEWFDSLGWPLRLIGISPALPILEYLNDAFVIVSGLGYDLVPHAVIYRRGGLVHDPSSEPLGLFTIETAWLFTVLDPSFSIPDALKLEKGS